MNEKDAKQVVGSSRFWELIGKGTAAGVAFTLLTGERPPDAFDIAKAMRDVPENIRRALDEEGGPMPYESNAATTFTIESGSIGGGEQDSYLLTEDGGYLLTEDGGRILLEDGDVSSGDVS